MLRVGRDRTAVVISVPCNRRSAMKTKIYEDMADLFPLWRQTTLGLPDHEKQETDFVLDVFTRHTDGVRTIIDLGGGVGLHAGLLLQAGYDVTLFDQSEKALSIARKNHPNLKLVRGSFETIDVREKFDAAICMWSTLSYVLSEEGRKTFYDWQRTHIRKLIVLDEANFYKYPASFHRAYEGENEKYKMTVFRDWNLSSENLKDTKFVYELVDKKTGQKTTIDDAEQEQYVTVDQLQKYLGLDWTLSNLCGDYDLQKRYDRQESPRMIPIFCKQGISL